MNESTNREKVLKKVRNALLTKTANPFPNIDFDTSVFHSNDLPLEVNFAEKFAELGGHFILCDNSIETIEMLLALCEQNEWKEIYCTDKNLSAFLTGFEFPHHNTFDFDKTVHAAVVSCAGIVSRNGEIIFSPIELPDEKLFSVAANVIVIADSSQLKGDLKELLLSIKEKNNKKWFSFISIVNPKSFGGQIFVLLNQEEKRAE